MILNSVSLGLRLDADVSENDIDHGLKRILKNGDSEVNNKDCSDASDTSRDGLSESQSVGSVGEGSQAWSGDEDKRVTRVIGELPIAEYEGSPRRYGVGPQITTNIRSPRPGFPQVKLNVLISNYSSFEFIWGFIIIHCTRNKLDYVKRRLEMTAA